MKVHPNVDIYTVLYRNPRKTVQKASNKKQNTTTYWKPKEYWISKYKRKGAHFLHL